MKLLHHNANSCYQSIKDYVKDETFDSKMSIVAQLKPKHSKEEFEQLLKDLHDYMGAGFHTVTAQMSIITYFLYKYPEQIPKLREEI